MRLVSIVSMYRQINRRVQGKLTLLSKTSIINRWIGILRGIHLLSSTLIDSLSQASTTPSAATRAGEPNPCVT